MKKSLVYIVLIVISLFTIYKASLIYETFLDNNIPVYDSVNYEKNQIEQFIRFKDNFSLWKRKTEIKYQLQFNSKDGGYFAMLMLLNPKLLFSDLDILIRSFISMLIFSITLFHFLEYKTNSTIKRLLIIILLLQFPLFYNERYGLATYIPELPSALLLLSGYLCVLLFFRKNKIFHLLLGLTLMLIPVILRLNFFIYSGLLILPLIYGIILRVVKLPTVKQILVYLYVVFLLIIVGSYFLYYLQYFREYYVKPSVEWEDYGDLYFTLKKFSENYINQIGVYGLLFIIFINLIRDKINENLNFNKLLFFVPFCFPFLLVFVINKSPNVPHVVSAMSIFSLLIILNIVFKKIKLDFINNKIIYFAFGIFFFSSLFIFFNNLQKVKLTYPEHETANKTVSFIVDSKLINNDFKYISFADDVAEIPIDVALLKKTGVYLKSNDHFYYHNWGWYHNISKDLNVDTCVNHYTERIDENYYDLIIMNDTINTLLSHFPISVKVHNRVEDYITKSKQYKLVFSKRTQANGVLNFYLKNKEDIMK